MMAAPPGSRPRHDRPTVPVRVSAMTPDSQTLVTTTAFATQGGSVFNCVLLARRRRSALPKGQPSGNMNSPDRVRQGEQCACRGRQGAPTVVDSNGNGNIDPGEIATLTIPLENYVAVLQWAVSLTPASMQR